MKLPWNKKYLTISFHVVMTFFIIYILKKLIDGGAFALANLNKIFVGFSNVFSWLFSVFAVVLIAFVFAYIFDPVVDFFQNLWEKNTQNINFKFAKHKNNSQYKERKSGTIITYLVIILVLTIILTVIIQKINSMGENGIVENSTAFINNSVQEFTLAYDKLEDLLTEYGLMNYFIKIVNRLILGLTNFISNLSSNFVSLISTIGEGIINIVIGIVVAFFFLKDKQKIINKVKSAGRHFLPIKVNRIISSILSDVNDVFSGYIRGQLIDASIMTVLISGSLYLVGIPYAIIIGVISGFSNIIPYFGAFVGFALAVSSALLSGSITKAIYASFAIFVLQQLDSFVIIPKIVGEKVELSPASVLIALAVFGKMFGIIGMIFAVPAFAILKILLTKILDRYPQKSNK